MFYFLVSLIYILHSILRLLQNSFIAESLWSVADHFHVNRHCFSLMFTFFRRRFTCVVISASPSPPPHFWQPTNCIQYNSSYVRWRYLPKDPPIRLVSTQIYTHLGLFLVFSIWIFFLILVFQEYRRIKIHYVGKIGFYDVNSLTPKITWLLILLSSYYKYPCKLVMRIWCKIKITTSTWLVWIFSLPVCRIM